MNIDDIYGLFPIEWVDWLRKHAELVFDDNIPSALVTFDNTKKRHVIKLGKLVKKLYENNDYEIIRSVVKHESMHIIRGDLAQIKQFDYDSDAWNVASDIIINRQCGLEELFTDEVIKKYEFEPCLWRNLQKSAFGYQGDFTSGAKPIYEHIIKVKCKLLKSIDGLDVPDNVDINDILDAVIEANIDGRKILDTHTWKDSSKVHIQVGKPVSKIVKALLLAVSISKSRDGKVKSKGLSNQVLNVPKFIVKDMIYPHYGKLPKSRIGVFLDVSGSLLSEYDNIIKSSGFLKLKLNADVYTWSSICKKLEDGIVPSEGTNPETINEFCGNYDVIVIVTDGLFVERYRPSFDGIVIWTLMNPCCTDYLDIRKGDIIVK